VNYYKVTITDEAREHQPPVEYREKASRIGLAADRALTLYLKQHGHHPTGRTMAVHHELRVDVRRVG
jgi:hypothetical protein